MFLIDAEILAISKKQYFYKLKAYMNMFCHIVVVQLIALLLSFGGIGMMGTSSNNLNLDIKRFSGDFIIGFTIFLIIVVAVTITNKGYRDADFTFVSNRTSNGISNCMFLATYCVIAGTTAYLGGILLRVVVYFITGEHTIIGDNFIIKPEVLIIGIISTILYLALFSSAGYFVGTLLRIKGAVITLIPLFSIAVYLSWTSKSKNVFLMLVELFTGEESLFLFAIKVIITGILFFTGSILLFNRMEVKK